MKKETLPNGKIKDFHQIGGFNKYLWYNSVTMKNALVQITFLNTPATILAAGAGLRVHGIDPQGQDLTAHWRK